MQIPFHGILTGKIIVDVTAAMQRKLPGSDIKVMNYDQITAFRTDGQAGGIVYQAGRFYLVGDSEDGFGTFAGSANIDNLNSPGIRHGA